MNLLSQYIIYKYNDMSSLFVSGLSHNSGDYNYYGYLNSTLSTKLNLNIFTELITKFLWLRFDPILTNNLLVLAAFILNILFAYKLFNHFSKSKSKYLSLLFSITWSLSPYFLFRVMAGTAELYFVFVFPFLLYLLIGKKKPLILSLYTLAVFQVSAYYGYFAFLTVLFWQSSQFVYTAAYEKKLELKSITKGFAIFLIPILAFFLVFYREAVFSNLRLGSNYEEHKNVERYNSKTVFRPIENFYNFSLRPWYFVIPPKSSLFFSGFSQNTYERIRSTNYYLADDYSESEMGGSFIGWPFLVGSLVFFYMFVFKKNVGKLETKLFFTLLLLLLFSGPPSFTVSGIEIYTPSYLLYYLVPGFRVLARFASVIFLIVMLLNFSVLLKAKNSKLQNVAGTLIFILNFFSLAISMPLINVNEPPERYLAIKSPSDAPMVVLSLPESSYEDVFWTLHHNNYLFNPKGFVNTAKGFDADEFTASIVEGDLDELQEYGVNFVTVNLNSKNENLEKILRSLRTIYGQEIFLNKNAAIFQIQ